MKKNLLLLLTAIALAIFTYFFQEVGDQKKKQAKALANRILDPKELGELRGFALSKVEITKQGKHYLVTDKGQLADERKIEAFMQLLTAIKVKRVLSADELKNLDKDLIFPLNEEVMTFVFSQQKVSFRLGKKLEFDRSFYMEVQQGEKKNVVIAFDSSDLNGVYQKGDAHRAEHHYKRFQSLFYLDSQYFLDFRIFRTWMKSEWSLKTIELNNSRNRAFTVDFINALTNPPIPKNLSLKRKKVLDFEKKIALLEGKSLGPQNSSLYNLDNSAVMKVKSSRGEATLSLVALKSDEKKKFIHSSLDNFYYEIEKKESDLFLGHVQLFWDLRYLKSTPKSLSLKFNEISKKVELVRAKGLFQVTSPDSKPKHITFKKLTDLLGSPANYWVFGAEVEQNYIYQFELDWGLGPFYLMIRSAEILVYDKLRKEGLVYTFNSAPPIGLVYGDYFL